MWYPRAFYLLLGLCGLIQDAAGMPLERVVFSNITRSHGMRPGEVRALFQDRKGNHWMATAAGLSKFDGIELTHYDSGGEERVPQLPKNLAALAQDVDDALWLGSDGQGLCRFEPGVGVRERFDVASGLAHDCVTSLRVDGDGSLWIGTRAGLNWLERKTQRIEPVRIEAGTGSGLEEVLSIELGPGGALWVALARRGIFRRAQGGAWTLMWKSSSGAMQTALAPDGDLWAQFGEEGVVELSGTGDGARLHEIPRWVMDRGTPGSEILSIEADGFGDIWLGTGKGLLKYVVGERRWTLFQHRDGAPGSLVRGRITCLLEDRRSVLWAGSDQGELSWHPLTRSWFPVFSAERDGLDSDDVHGFSPGRDGGVWVATGKGLNRFDVATGEISRLPVETGGDAPAQKEFLCVMEDRSGRIWAGTRKDGLAMRPSGGAGFQFFRHSPMVEDALPEGAVTALFEDHLGQVWAAVAGNGIVRFSPGNGGRFHRLLPEGRAAEMLFVNDFERDGEQGAWLATVGGGLWHLDAGTGRLQPLRERLELREELPSDNLLDVLRSRDGDLWIGTFGGGLVRLRLETGALERFDRWEGRLPDWSACGLVEDHAGMIWVATAAGLLRIDPQKGGVRRFGIQDGLQATGFRSRSAQRLADGRLLFGGANGFNLIDPQRLPAEVPPPRPLLAGLELNGEPVKPSPQGDLLRKPLALTNELRLAYDPRMRFALRYGTVSFADEGQVSFRFRMIPLDAKWQRGTVDQRATYQGLKPGDYQFVVQTSRDGQNWNSATSSIRVVIMPPWFRTWWANLLGLISLVAGSVYAGKAFHRRKLVEQSIEKQRIENQRNQAEAALTRQLQHSMLVEQSMADFRKGVDPKAVFEGTLERLTKHLRLSRCLVYWEPEHGGSGQGRILAECGEKGGGRLAESAAWAGSSGLQTLLRSEGSLALYRPGGEGNETALREWQEFWGDEVGSVLAVRTVYEGRPNGVLVLEVHGEERLWSSDERDLAESIAGHLGLALAQFELSQREASHRRELEEARLRADAANKAKGDFLAKMTHELRTPLCAIIGFAEILEKEGRSNPEVREALEGITSSAEHLLGVIHEVLEVSKLEAGKVDLAKDEMDLPKTLHSIRAMLAANAARKGLRLEVVPLSELPGLVEIDKAKLRQILVNLLNNAVKFTEKGGVSLRVLARPRRCADQADIRPDRRAVELVFEVLDTGPGIAEEEIPRLFQTYVQTQSGRRSKEGTGLGLVITKGFAELMGGSIEVASRVGFGTLFTVRLPVWEIVKAGENSAGDGKAGTKRRRSAESRTNVPPGIRVLVVEDQLPNRLLLKKLLLRVGCVLEEAENGREAVGKWRSFQPDIILMDESMPLMTGTEAAKQILDQAGEARPAIISLTAFAMVEQREAAMEAGFAGFLPKPFKQEELYALLAKHAPQDGEMRRAA